MKNSPDRQFEQPVLPTSVRQAIGIVLLASLPTGCTTSKRTNIQAPTIVEVPTAEASPQEPMPDDTKEVLTREKDFTPQAALRAALSEPLQFAYQLTDGPNTSPVCFWRNNKVLVRTDHCEKYQQDKVDGTKDQYLNIGIHSPEGKTVIIMSGAPAGKSVYDVKKNEYTLFQLLYIDLSSDTSGYKHNSEPMEFEVMMEVVVDSVLRGGKIPHCNAWPGDDNNGKVTCEGGNYNTPLKNAIKDFSRKPGKDWYTFLQTIKKLHDQHGFR